MENQRPSSGLHTIDRKKIRGRALTNQTLRFAFAGKIHLPSTVGGDLLERFRLLRPINVIRRRSRKFRELRRLRFADHDDAIGVWIIERAKEHAVHDRENCGTGADAEREGQDGNGGEAWIF